MPGTCWDKMVKVYVGTEKEYYLDGYLKENLDIAKKVIVKDWDMIFIVDGYEGCLTGDTKININRGGNGRTYKLDYMHYQYHKSAKLSRDKMWDLDIPSYVRSFDGDSIKLHKLKDVVYSGEKEVWHLKLENGKTIKATKDHRIMTKSGWKQLQELNTSDLVMCDTLLPIKGKQKSYKLKDISLFTANHPFKNVRGEVEVHRLIYESHLNKLKFMEYMDILWNDEVTAHILKYVDPKQYHIHHKDGCHYNNNINNLKLLSVRDHKVLHSEQDKSFKNFNQGVPIYSRVIDYGFVGINKTYDIICEQPHHNFVANGIVVHNSGKSTIGIQSAGYCDPSFNNSRIVFTPKQFKDAILSAEPYQAVVYDEAYTGLSSRAAMGKINRALVSMLAEIRQKNLFIFVIMPTFFDLDKYVALWRSRALIHVYTNPTGRDRFQRGFFSFYNEKRKKQLFVLGKKFYSYYKPKPNFIGRFTKAMPIDSKLYKKQKKDSLVQREQNAEEQEHKEEVDNKLFLRVMEMKNLTHEKKMDILQMARSTYFWKLKKYNESEE